MPETNDDLAVEIGRRIAARRNQLRLTQEEAAERAGLTQQFFASVEPAQKYSSKKHYWRVKSTEYQY